MSKKLTLVRLEKETAGIQKDPIPNFLVKRVGTLHFHFCIFNLQDAYKGGFYHGVLQLHQDYPFQPPVLKFFTPSGRFQIDKPICTSFTNFHKQTWSSAWNVRTMLMGVVSFMTSNQGGYGSLNSNYVTRRQYAQKSLEYNMKNQTFKSLFKKSIEQKKLVNIEQIIEMQSNKNNSNNKNERVQQSTKVYFLYGLLVALVIIYMVIKNN